MEIPKIAKISGDFSIYAWLYFIEQKKKTLKIFGSRTWCTKKHFGYRVAHHRIRGTDTF